jgi:hypothetical protein
MPHALHCRPGTAHHRVHRVSAARRVPRTLQPGSCAQRPACGGAGVRCRSTRPSTAMSYAMSRKTCWPAWTRPSRRSSDAFRQARRRASRAFRGAPATTASPTRRMATARGAPTAFWCCPRSGGLVCAGHARERAHWRAHPRPSPSPTRPMAGRCASPAPMFPRSPCRRRDVRRAVMWG